MVATKEQNNTDPEDDKILALPTRLSKLEKNKTSVLEKVQGGGGNITHNHTNSKGRYPNKSYVQVLNNLESQRVNISKDNITRDGQYWYWCPKNKMKGKFDGMYMNHQDNKHAEWAEENQSKIES